MILHKYITVKRNLIIIQGELQDIEKSESVRIILEYRSFFITAGRNVVECSLKFYSQSPYHGFLISEEWDFVKSKDLTPYTI
jgi:hypothetical protein